MSRAGSTRPTHLLQQRPAQNRVHRHRATRAIPEFHDRWRGYCRALRAAGIEPDERPLRRCGPERSRPGAPRSKSCSQRGVEFDAIFAASDVAAIGAMHALQKLGRSIPDEVAIVGFDDIPAASLSSPPLTTVTQDARQAGEALVEAAVEAVEYGNARTQLLPVQPGHSRVEHNRLNRCLRGTIRVLRLARMSGVRRESGASHAPRGDGRWRSIAGRARSPVRSGTSGGGWAKTRAAGALAVSPRPCRGRRERLRLRPRSAHLRQGGCRGRRSNAEVRRSRLGRGRRAARLGRRAALRAAQDRRRPRIAPTPWRRTDSRRSAATFRKTALAGTALRSPSHPATAGVASGSSSTACSATAIVFVNGYVVHRNESGYAPFSVRIDDFVDYDGGPNIVTVRADATLGEGWFYEGAGIYRHVELVRADTVHIPQWGTFVRSEIRGKRAQLFVTTEIMNSGTSPVAILLRQQVFDASESLGCRMRRRPSHPRPWTARHAGR